MTPPHGYSRYKLHGCRCYVCALAVSEYNLRRERQIAYGRWQPYADAEPVREHVRALQAAGLGTRRIAELAGISRTRVADLLKGKPGRAPAARIRTETARKLLAVKPVPAAHVPVDITGTLRRIQALVAAGWPMAQLAARLGMTGANFHTLLGQEAVLPRTADAVRGLYRDLCGADPAAHGVGAQSISRARNHASRSGWAPSTVWDDDTIDDPAAHPEWTGACGTVEGHGIHRRERIPVRKPCAAASAAYRRDLYAQRRGVLT